MSQPRLAFSSAGWKRNLIGCSWGHLHFPLASWGFLLRNLPCSVSNFEPDKLYPLLSCVSWEALG